MNLLKATRINRVDDCLQIFVIIPVDKENKKGRQIISIPEF